MDNPDEVPQAMATWLQIQLQASPTEVVFACFLIAFLLFLSALISGSEVAFFSLSRPNLEELEESEAKSDKDLLQLLSKPKELLAGLLIANNLVNVSIVIISYYVTVRFFTFGDLAWLGLLIQTVVITFLIVMFGEVVPKVYATENNLLMSRKLQAPIRFLVTILKPFISILVRGTQLIDGRFKKYNQSVSKDELNQAIELTYEEEPAYPDEKDILKGIVNFGEITTRQIMVPRQQIKAVDLDEDFEAIKSKLIEWGYSRVPVYKESLDRIEGILYLKDLLTKTKEGAEYEWRVLLRKPFFVPEKKKIDDLFRDFQKKHTHMAVVVDEYGGCAGLITLEDVLEEIVGEINDEYDEVEESPIQRLEENVYLCEASVLLHDLSRQTGLELELFENYIADADTLAGLVLELAGKFPDIGEEINYEKHRFWVVEADDRRIIKIKLELPAAPSEETEEPSNADI